MRVKIGGFGAVILTLFALARPASANPLGVTNLWLADVGSNGELRSFDDVFGFPDPTITGFVGDTLYVVTGFEDDGSCESNCGGNWSMHFDQIGGTLSLPDTEAQFVEPNDDHSPAFRLFSLFLSTPGSWTGFLQPFEHQSCQSGGEEGDDNGDGEDHECGGPTSSHEFELNVLEPVPEPGTWMLFGTGLAFAGIRRWRKRTTSK